MWDGYYGVETNCKDLTGTLVLKIYHELWKIEEAFRHLKSHLEARPIFHFTKEEDKRTHGIMLYCISIRKDT